jgi:CheY-like chemotaxis protein
MIRGSKWQLSRVLAYAMDHAVESLDARSPGENTLSVEVRTDARGWAELRMLARRRPGPVPLPSRESDDRSVEVTRTTSVSMTMAQHLVERHGGELLVHEQPDGRLLELRFPPMTAAAVLPDAAAGAARRGSVLVVDDEPMVGRVLAMTLRSEHDVTVVASAASALTLLERGDAFDVILCDLSMPGVDGQQLYERLCVTRPDLASRMIFMSGGAIAGRAARFLEDMAGRRIDKPFQTAHLLELLREKVRSRGNPPPPARC